MNKNKDPSYIVYKSTNPYASEDFVKARINKIPLDKTFLLNQDSIQLRKTLRSLTTGLFIKED